MLFQNMLLGLADEIFEQMTSSAHNFSKTKVFVGKIFEQCFFKFVSKYVTQISRRHCQQSKIKNAGS
jgi:hypothetical protein